MIMTIKRIDARGLSCPQPVVLVDRAVQEGNTDLEILVDNEVSRENVLRMATRRGLKTDVRREGSDTIIRATRAQ
jgi:TusA-related sulfurtransferase